MMKRCNSEEGKKIFKTFWMLEQMEERHVAVKPKEMKTSG